MHPAEASGPARPPRRDTRGLLLDAARRIFARDGIEAATTRSIARAAGVNEVTLFRHFRTKEGLLDAVVRRSFPGAPAGAPEMTGDLRADLDAFAQRYEVLLEQNITLVRTLVGDIHRHRRHAEHVLGGIFSPLRAALITRLRRAAADGELRADIDPEVAADLFNGAIFAGVFRRACAIKVLSYEPSDYLSACVAAFHRGLAEETRPARRR